MNYQKIYNSLCERGKRDRDLTEYTEKHHIVPKCMGGTDDRENMCVLTYREHFIAHHLLCKINPNFSPLHSAFMSMVRKSKNSERIVTSRMFDRAKRVYRDYMICNPDQNPMNTHPHTNPRSQAIKVYFSGGKIKTYLCIKHLADDIGVNYNVVRGWVLKNVKNLHRHGICWIFKIDKEEHLNFVNCHDYIYRQFTFNFEVIE